VVCPNCKLINTPETERCECGYDFQRGEMTRRAKGERNEGSVGKGVGIGLLLALCWLVLATVTVLSSLTPGSKVLVFMPPVEVLLFMIPAFIAFQGRGETETAKGIVVIGAIVFLLSATCSGVLSGFFGAPTARRPAQVLRLRRMNNLTFTASAVHCR
jgi:hypothetical protein